jgi:hypothetical protein
MDNALLCQRNPAQTSVFNLDWPVLPNMDVPRSNVPHLHLDRSGIPFDDFVAKARLS